MNDNTGMAECNDTVTVDHWIGKFKVNKIDSTTGNLHLVGCGLSGWVPATHAHRVVAATDVATGEVLAGTV